MLVRCPECGAIISPRFPLHDCKPRGGGNIYVINEFVEAEKQALALVETWDDIPDAERREAVRGIALTIGMGSLELGKRVQSGELSHRQAHMSGQ